jgi:hypothetical protein
MNMREDRRRAGFIISLELLFIATCVLWLLIVLWPALRTKAIQGLRELAAASSQTHDPQQGRAGPGGAAPASRAPLPPRGYRPAPGRALVIRPEDPQALADPNPAGGIRFGPPPTLGTSRLRPPMPEP